MPPQITRHAEPTPSCGSTQVDIFGHMTLADFIPSAFLGNLYVPLNLVEDLGFARIFGFMRTRLGIDAVHFFETICSLTIFAQVAEPNRS